MGCSNTSSCWLGSRQSGRRDRLHRFSRKVDVLPGRMPRAGLPEALVEAVVCPIGLNIGAETPEEIAVAVAAAIMAAEAGLAPGEPTWRDAM